MVLEIKYAREGDTETANTLLMTNTWTVQRIVLLPVVLRGTCGYIITFICLPPDVLVTLAELV